MCKIITGSYDQHSMQDILKTKEDSGVSHFKKSLKFMLKTETLKTKY